MKTINGSAQGGHGLLFPDAAAADAFYYPAETAAIKESARLRAIETLKGFTVVTAGEVDLTAPINLVCQNHAYNLLNLLKREDLRELFGHSATMPTYIISRAFDANIGDKDVVMFNPDDYEYEEHLNAYRDLIEKSDCVSNIQDIIRTFVGGDATVFIINIEEVLTVYITENGKQKTYVAVGAEAPLEGVEIQKYERSIVGDKPMHIHCCSSDPLLLKFNSGRIAELLKDYSKVETK